MIYTTYSFDFDPSWSLCWRQTQKTEVEGTKSDRNHQILGLWISILRVNPTSISFIYVYVYFWDYQKYTYTYVHFLNLRSKEVSLQQSS